MIQRDFILRMIEEIGRFLAKISGMRDKQLVVEGYDEFLSFVKAHFKIAEKDISLSNLETLEENLKTALEQYPDELGQLLSGGAELARDVKKGEVAEVLYLLAWKSLKKAEDSSSAYRFERLVEMNGIKEKLALMGINVE